MSLVGAWPPTVYEASSNLVSFYRLAKRFTPNFEVRLRAIRSPLVGSRYTNNCCYQVFLAQFPLAHAKIGAVMFAAAFHTSRHYILFTAMACLCVLLGGPSYAAGIASKMLV